MAQEKIQAIREAEIVAANSIKAANLKKESILNDAKVEATRIEKNMIAETDKKSEELKKKADKENESAIEAAIKMAENEITRIKGIVGSRQAEATKLIMAEII